MLNFEHPLLQCLSVLLELKRKDKLGRAAAKRVDRLMPSHRDRMTTVAGSKEELAAPHSPSPNTHTRLKPTFTIPASKYGTHLGLPDTVRHRQSAAAWKLAHLTERKDEKTTPFGINLMRVLYRAAQMPT
ncbi:MAG: hypothetical protein FRX49_08303 [Trebouxia sp. A1-2]|nr:MAG: hypothetical protein FRX49_08303 [Trebouxia sp. A1-2]